MMDKPLYRVAAAGLDPRDARLIEIVFRHSQYNRYAFQFVPADSFESVDILIVNTVEAEGLRALARMRTLGADVPVVTAVPRGAPSSSRHAISIDRLTLQLLPILNRVVELELVDPDTRPMSVPTPDFQARAAPSPVSGARATPAAAAMQSSSAGARAMGQAPATAPLAMASLGSVREQPATPPRAPVAETGVAAPAQRPSVPAGLPRPPQPAQSLCAPIAPPRAPTFPVPPGDLPRRRADQTPARPATTSPGRGPTRAGPASPPPLQPGAGAPRVQVLVVDDSPTVRRQLTLAFERMGIACDAVPSAIAGLERMATIRYDLVLVDVVMPEVDGYQLTREIRRRHRGIPVIILTSRSSPFDLARGALSGCSSYLVKPVTLRKLEAAVIKVLRKTLAIDDVSGLLRPISLYAPASSRPSESDGAGGRGGRK